MAQVRDSINLKGRTQATLRVLILKTLLQMFVLIFSFFNNLFYLNTIS